MSCTPPSSAPLPAAPRPATRIPVATILRNPTPRPNNPVARAAIATRPNNRAVCRGTPAAILPTHGDNPALGAALLGALTLTFTPSGTYTDRQDDDTRITVDGRVVWDPRKNVSWYASGAVVLTAQQAGIVHGSLVTIECFDGWGPGWVSKPWNALVTWADGSVSAYSGGSLFNGDSGKPAGDAKYYTNGPHFLHYHPNGGFTALRA